MKISHKLLNHQQPEPFIQGKTHAYMLFIPILTLLNVATEIETQQTKQQFLLF